MHSDTLPRYVLLHWQFSNAYLPEIFHRCFRKNPLLRTCLPKPLQQARRLETAKVELAAEKEFDVTVVNDSVERAAKEIAELIGAA